MTKTFRSGFLVAMLAACSFAMPCDTAHAATSARASTSFSSAPSARSAPAPSTSGLGVSRPQPAITSPPPAATPSPTAGLGVSRPPSDTAAPAQAATPAVSAPPATAGLGASKPGTQAPSEASSPPLSPTAGLGVSRPGTQPQQQQASPPQATAGLGVSKPGQQPATNPQPTAGLGASKPGTQPAAAVNTPPQSGPRPPPGILATASTKQMSAQSLRQLDADKARANAPAQPVNVAAARQDPVFAQARSSYGGDTSRYYSDRTAAMGGWRTSHVIYVHDMRPNYGIYDVLFLATLMEASNANWAYSHHNDPWYSDWHADQMRQAANNEQLRAQMAQMDAKIAELERDKAPVMAPGALPPGVSPAIAIAPETMSADEFAGAGKASFWTFGHVMLMILAVGGISIVLVLLLRPRA